MWFACSRVLFIKSHFQAPSSTAAAVFFTWKPRINVLIFQTSSPNEIFPSGSSPFEVAGYFGLLIEVNLVPCRRSFNYATRRAQSGLERYIGETALFVLCVPLGVVRRQREIAI